MDGDEYENNGPSGFAWFQLGRMSEQRSQSQKETLDSLFGRSPVSADAYNQQVAIGNDWRAECLRLQQINAKLVADLNASRKHAADLKAWGDAIVEDRARLQAEFDGQRRLTHTYLKRADRFQNEIDRLTGNT